MRVHELMERLDDFNSEAQVRVFCIGGMWDSCAGATDQANGDQGSNNPFVVAVSDKLHTDDIMRVSDLLSRLENHDPEAQVMVSCNGGLYDSCADGTDDANEDQDGDDGRLFVVAAATT